MIAGITPLLLMWMAIVAALLGYHAFSSKRYKALTAYFACLVIHNGLVLFIQLTNIPIDDFIVQPFRSLNTILMYFAVKELLFADYRYTPKMLLHLIIPATFLILIGVGGFTSSQLIPVMAAVSLPYILANYRTIHKFNQLWSNIQARDTHPIAKWLKYYLHYYSFMITVEIYRAWFDDPGLLVAPHRFMLLITCIFLTVLICKLLSQARFFPDIDQDDVAIVQNKPALASNEPARHYRDEYPLLEQQLVELMEENRPFLNPNICLKTMANELSTSSRALSELINDYYKCNFSDYINRARVEEAKRLIEDLNEQNQSLFDVALNSGFNSKSSFNVMFKRHAGLTPSAYRRQFLNSLSDQPQH